MVSLSTVRVRENYHYETDHNVPRNGMYEHYRSWCESYNIQPVNSATFGKLIRHVFPDITTRRLGTRGQSKYHYCGIRRLNQQPLAIEEGPSGTAVAHSGAQRQLQRPQAHRPMLYASS